VRRPRVLLLVDWDVGDDAFWLRDLLTKRGFDVLTLGIPHYSMRNREVKWRKVVLWWQYVALGYRGARIARRGPAVIVSWNFIPGVFAAQFSRISPEPRSPVLSLNAIAHRNDMVRDAVRWLVYRTAFASGLLWVTVNTEELRERFETQFGFLPARVEVLPDCWEARYETGDPSRPDEGYIFVGGEASRDWELVLDIAECCSDLQFEIVARRKHWPMNRPCPRNVHLRFDTSEQEFYRLVAGSRLVLMPLVDRMTAGLIVLIRAALLGRLVLATRTPATETCYPAELAHLFVDIGDAEGFCTLIRALWHDENGRVHAARALQSYVHERRSPDAFADRIADLVRRVISEAAEAPTDSRTTR